jgi:hypothetical protein
MHFVHQLLGRHYQLFQVFVNPSDVGFSCTNRPRTFVYCAHKLRTVALYDPGDLLCAMREVGSEVHTTPADVMVATNEEVFASAWSIAQSRRISFHPERDLRFLLNEREQVAEQVYEKAYIERFGVSPESDRDCAFYLGDNPLFTRTWSCASGKLPAFRTGNGFTYFPFFKRIMVPVDRLTAMGFPIRECFANVLNIKGIPCRDPKRASDICGNSMHFMQVAVMSMIGLACFGLRP